MFSEPEAEEGKLAVSAKNKHPSQQHPKAAFKP
jgi:hypothetical protein